MSNTINWPLKASIVEKFGTAADFSHVVKEPETVVSKVIRGRRTLSEDKKRKWAEALGVENYEALFGEREA